MHDEVGHPKERQRRPDRLPVAGQALHRSRSRVPVRAAQEVTAVAERDGAIPYDVGGVELGHVDGRCSFESIVLKYGLEIPALDRLAQIVHGADVSADIDQTPEAAGLKAIAHGFAIVHGENDH